MKHIDMVDNAFFFLHKKWMKQKKMKMKEQSRKREMFIMDDMSSNTGIKQASGVPTMNG